MAIAMLVSFAILAQMHVRLAALAMVLVTGCAGLTQAQPASPSRPDTLLHWQYVANSRTVGGAARPLVVNDPEGHANLRLQFWNAYLGIVGCNFTSARDWSVASGVLRAPRVDEGWTLIACPAEAEAQDLWFADFITSQPTLAADSDQTFTLTSGDTSLTFVRETALPNR